jgi:4a-hydroxytetrahydrobiopterin dehydratase
MKCLSYDKIKEALPEGWRIHGNCSMNLIRRRFEFKDFNNAWKFMNKIAKKAEAMNHHPDWSNVYNKVTITLQTHDAGGVTQKDINLAEYINKTAK